MSDYFTERFLNDAVSFAELHKGLENHGFVTEDDEPRMNRPIHNSLTKERYKKMFETHYPGQYTAVKAASCAFDVGDGFPSFYVAFDTAQFKDQDALEIKLKKIGVLE
ncbi:hypothetical protein GJ698_15035 [Pseudoduganella sp. FT26W]|uniref:Uncharacterized protein n=1 Tax=Duganella aquatilis TaxID=2666082 RepID=A0A844DCT7_9BURK|nr:hypothetical protein [Duganella aquatilis]MRW85399.1 hypothetical protein [Duganella aquatilis]